MMNYPDFLSAIAATENLSEELRSTAADLLAKHQKQTSAANARARAKKSAENAPLVEAVTSLLKANEGHFYTAAEIKNLVDGIESTSKATAVLKLVEGVKISDVTVDRRVVKGYSL